MNPATALVRGREALENLPVPLTVAAGQQHTAETILRAWFEGKSEHTVRSYRHDLEDFARYLSRALGISPPMDVNTTLSRLFRQSAPSAHEIALGFRHWMGDAHLSAASINRHLACLRSVTKLGRMLGMMTWYLEVPGVKAEPRRQTAGPAVEDIRRMLAATSGDTEAETRDYAIVLTFYWLETAPAGQQKEKTAVRVGTTTAERRDNKALAEQATHRSGVQIYDGMNCSSRVWPPLRWRWNDSTSPGRSQVADSSEHLCMEVNRELCECMVEVGRTYGCGRRIDVNRCV
jgi:hypothetical protein